MKNKNILKLLCIYILLIVVFIGLSIKPSKYKSSITNDDKVLSSTVISKDEGLDEVVSVLAEETINLSHYGHDCYGCGAYTSSGYYVGDGRIYYEDLSFGLVRVVAADRKYPLGSILRIEYYDSVITAIVLDRGGAIGDGKKFQIDLLVSSEDESYELGILRNTNLEVLRLGY